MQRPSAQFIERLEQRLTADPNNLPLLSQLANALVNDKRPADALPLFARAMQLLPDDPRLLNDRALALTALGRFDDARADLATALQEDPAFVPAHNNLANLLIMMGRHREALTSLDVALMLDPSHASALRNRGIAHLSLGNFDAGRDDYDRACTAFPDSPLPYPEWTGQPLTGKRLLLLTTRHGLGDTIQFIRFAPQLKSRGAHIILQCAMPLAELLRSMPGVHELITHTDPTPHADYALQLVSLLRVLKITLDTIPANVPYITADPQRVATWKERLAQLRQPNHKLIGIAWQGNPHHQWDQFRSAPLQEFTPLTKLPNIQLVSLQRGPGVEQIAPFQEATNGTLIVPTTGEQTEPAHLADAAAIIANLDALVTVDTFTAHLAAAMAKPVYVALSTVCDWRWLTDRSDSPWYPTLRLFRQQKLNDWPDVFHRIAECLRNDNRAMIAK